IGGESMTQAQLDRLQDLAMTTWQRHFDDRLGISSTEALRYPAKKPPLPATEPLLADQPQHIIERRQDMDDGRQYGIRMEIPRHLYNLGELYNLSVTRGTLTKEDRFKIKEHMISTIKMLESLPFPNELARVPRYASTHHETLKGDGYPRKLTGAELSIPERIIAVADIFEALTASDRPYKKAKTLSEAIHILYQMAKAGHIDRDVFELFLTSEVYLTYGKRFLPPEQLDFVPIARYLRRG
ncbi:MAG TPA: HD domain-containing phosphohydrolase, partial [Desulfosalsimonadaceae bacterium]|nr:HD domain-containing phosphohydrolase [Desulfosalsimonadaceae bacterium]